MSTHLPIEDLPDIEFAALSSIEREDSWACRLGRYRLLTKIATGGMAEIFLASEQGVGGLERLVVVKRILPHLADDPEFIDMFLREGRIAARLNHPNVVRIFELGEHRASYFLAMEYIEGSTLRELQVLTQNTQRGFPLDVAVGVIAQACRGLHAAHGLTGVQGQPLGLVHRDISPHNLMVTSEGDVRLLDFGVAKLTEVAAEATLSGTLKGKLAYLSPEQCTYTALDRRSDVFSLGIVLWELCTGQKLFRRDSELEMLTAITGCDAPRLSQLVPGFPGAIDEVIGKALERRREDRFHNAEDFRRALLKAAGEADLDTSHETIAAFVDSIAGEALGERRQIILKASTRPLKEHERVCLTHKTGAYKSDTPITKPAHFVLSERAGHPSLTSLRARPRRKKVKGTRIAAGIGVGLALMAMACIAITQDRLSWAPAPENPRTLTFGWAPTVDPEVLAKETVALRNYLQRKLGQPVNIVITRDYADLSARLSKGEVDFASLPPLLFLRTRTKGIPLESLAIKEFDGATGSDGYLLTRTDAPVGGVASLRGKRFCLTDKNSTTGNFLPRHYLRELGHEPETFIGAVHWSGDHTQVLRDLLDGKCDAAATYSGAVHFADDLGLPVGQLRVVAITGYIPQDTICAGKGASIDERHRFKKALMDFDPMREFGVSRLGRTQRISGFTETAPNTFTALERMIAFSRPTPATAKKAED